MSKPLCRVNCEVGNYTPSDIENLNLVEKIFSCYLNKGPLVGNVLPLFDYVSLNDKFLELQLGHRKRFLDSLN